MIIVGILKSKESDHKKNKKEKKKKTDAVFSCREIFALVVMVMPCGLTPVEGIDFV